MKFSKRPGHQGNYFKAGQYPGLQPIFSSRNFKTWGGVGGIRVGRGVSS